MPIFLLFIFGCNKDDELPVQSVSTKDKISEESLKEKIEKKENVLRFGFDLRGEPQEDVAQYLPFMKYLEEKTGFVFKLHFSPSTSSSAQELGLQHADFSIMGSLSFLKAESQYGAKILVRGVNEEQSASYKSVFITRINSDINTINDIKGTKLSFGSKDSTQGHLIPRIILKKNNIYLTNLKHYQYTGSHQECAEAVLSGRYDVCAMQEKLAKKLARQGLVKIIHTSSPYPSSGIAVSSKVPNDIVEIVQKALLEFQPQGRDKEGMYHWEYTEMPLGFVTATSKDYDELRVMANQFRLLDEEKSSQ